MTAEAAQAGGTARRGWRPDIWQLGALALAGCVSVPIVAVVVVALTPSEPVWGHLLETVLPGYTANTLALMLGVGIGVFAIGVSTAWLVTMCRFPGRGLFEWALLLPLAIPSYVIAIVYGEHLDYAGPVQQALRALFGWQTPQDYWFPEVRSLAGAILVMSLVLYPYVYLLTRAALLEQSVCVQEVARTLGRGPWLGFFTLALPLARPAIVVGVALALMETIADLGAVQILAVNTFTTGIYDVWLGLHNAPAAAQLSCVLLLFVLALILAERWSRRQRRYVTTSRRYRPLPGYRLTGWRAAAALAGCLLPLLLGFGVPAATLLDWCLETIGWARLDDFGSDVLHTLSLAGLAAALSACGALYLGYAQRLSRGPVLHIAVRFAALGYAVPGAIIAVGVLLPFAALDNSIDAVARSQFGVSTGLILSGTVVAVLFAYLVRFQALSFGSVEASLMRVTDSMDGAARTLGLGPLAVLWRVHAPLIRGGVLTGALLVFVDVMKELPATLMLRPFNFGTLATRVLAYANEERFEESAIWAMAIVLVGILPVILLSRAIARSRPGSEAQSGSLENAASGST